MTKDNNGQLQSKFTLPDGRTFESTWTKEDFEKNGFSVFDTDRTVFSGVPYYCISRMEKEKKQGKEGWFEIYFDGDNIVKIQEVGEFLDKKTIYKNKSLRYLVF